MLELKLFILHKDIIDLKNGNEILGYINGDKITHVEVQVPLSWVMSFNNKKMKINSYNIKQP